MDAFIEFITSDRGQVIGWCCTVLGLVLGCFATYKVHKLKISITQITNNHVANEVTENEVTANEITAPVYQEGEKNSNITNVHGDANITM